MLGKLMANSNSDYSPLLVLLLLGLQAVPLGGRRVVDVGLIVEAETIVGKMAKTCLSMGLEDFYRDHTNYTTRLALHARDSKSDVIEAASAAVDLLKNVQVQAILGSQSFALSDFVIDIGNKTQVPIISQATSPSLSPKENPYFIRAAPAVYAEVGALASIIKAFNWREIVLIYEDSSYGSGIVPYLTDALLSINIKVQYRSAISLSATDDHILQQLYKLQTLHTRVFVVHTFLPLASRLFLKVKEVGMMSQGYVWITTDVITSFLDSMDPTGTGTMQGVLGVKSYVPMSEKLDKFKKRWRKRFFQENPDIEHECELNAYGLWAYSSVKALAIAVEKTQISIPKFKKPNANGEKLIDLDAIGTSEMGPMLLQSIRNLRFIDLCGEFNLVDGELQSSTFQIVNVIGKRGVEIGFWSPKYGISKDLMPRIKDFYTTSKEDLKSVVWPGESNVVPKGWEMPTREKKLRVGVPVKSGFYEFIKVEKDPQTNIVSPIGFCVDVFKEVMDHYLPYVIPYEFIPFAGSYGDLVRQVALNKFDAVVGDITILASRSEFVDFTLPFTESGVAMIVTIEDDESKNAWIFMRPLTMDLWLTTGAFCIFIGFVVWVLEHRVNKEFRGPPHQQVGIIFWFSFSTLVFAHKEKVVNNLSRGVVVVWVFVVLVVTSSYTASLTSMLTVQKLQPTVTDLKDIIKQNGEYVGYPKGSFVGDFLNSLNCDPSKFKTYTSLQEYDEALSKGSKNGGVVAIVDELPYLRLFLSRYCRKYALVGPIYKTAGFGFAFKKGSPLVPDVSRAILRVKEGENMSKILAQWFGKKQDCAEQNGIVVTSGSLTVDSFKGLFLIAGTSTLFALIIFLSNFMYENKDTLPSTHSFRQKVATIVKSFDQRQDISSSIASKNPIATYS